MSKEIKLPGIIQSFIAAVNDHNETASLTVLPKMRSSATPPAVAGAQNKLKIGATRN